MKNRSSQEPTNNLEHNQDPMGCRWRLRTSNLRQEDPRSPPTLSLRRYPLRAPVSHRRILARPLTDSYCVDLRTPSRPPSEPLPLPNPRALPPRTSPRKTFLRQTRSMTSVRRCSLQEWRTPSGSSFWTPLGRKGLRKCRICFLHLCFNL